MSDPAERVEIEDVLASVRRLVSADRRDVPRRPVAGAEPDKLLLTPDFRVEARYPEPEPHADSVAASDVAPEDAAADDGAGWPGDAAGEAPEAAAAPAAPAAPAQPDLPRSERMLSLEERIAQLEAAVMAHSGAADFEPDGSEDQDQHIPSGIVGHAAIGDEPAMPDDLALRFDADLDLDAGDAVPDGDTDAEPQDAIGTADDLVAEIEPQAEGHEPEEGADAVAGAEALLSDPDTGEDDDLTWAAPGEDDAPDAEAGLTLEDDHFPEDDLQLADDVSSEDDLQLEDDLHPQDDLHPGDDPHEAAAEAAEVWDAPQVDREDEVEDSVLEAEALADALADEDDEAPDGPEAGGEDVFALNDVADEPSEAIASQAQAQGPELDGARTVPFPARVRRRGDAPPRGETAPPAPERPETPEYGNWEERIYDFDPDTQVSGLDFDPDTQEIDEEMLRDMVAEIVREELQGALGERITRNVRKLVRREIMRALSIREFE